VIIGSRRKKQYLRGKNLKNIVFRNCDILRGGNTYLDIQNGDCAEVSNILFEDIRVEYNSFDNKPILQDTDDDIYPGENSLIIPHLISIRNYRFRNDDYCGDIWGIPKDMANVNLDGIKIASVHDIKFRNITVFYDEKLPKVEGKYKVPIEIRSDIDGVEYYNIDITGLVINGVEIDEENAVLKIEKVKNFSIKKSEDSFSMLKKQC
jgi:hypothetical protein